MKIAITGGAGFLGINLVRYLLRNGFRDIVSLDIAKFDYPEKDRITEITGDIRDRKTVAELIKGADIVVHAAAALPLYTKEDIFSTDVEGTRNLLEEAYKDNVQRFIYISSTAVYGIPHHHPIYESDRLDGVGPYGKAKIMAEEICLEYRKKGMCVSIIRPKSFIGPERLGVFAIFYEWAKDGKNFPMIGNGKNRYQLLDVEDLCDAIYLCTIKERNIANDTFNIGAREFATAKEDYQAILDYAGFNKKIIFFPALPIIMILRILELLHLSPLYGWIYETAPKDSFISIKKAEKVLGFNPKYSNKDALIRNYKWYIENLVKFKNQSGLSHRLPWREKVLKLAKPFF